VKRVAPTQKPVGLFVQLIQDYGEDAHLILDGFLGSGTTLIACEKTNRTCYGMEIVPHYVDIIIKRYTDYVGSNEEVRGERSGEEISWLK
jgi:DNA modification methylase